MIAAAPRAYLPLLAPLGFVATVALGNLADNALGSLLEEAMVVTGLGSAIVCVYLWVDRLSLQKQLGDLHAEKRSLQQVVERKAGLEIDLEVTSAVRELALVAGNSNDLDQALEASAKLTHDLVHDISGHRHGVEVGLFFARPKGGRPILKCTANAAGAKVGKKAKPRDFVGAIPEGALAGAAEGEHNAPLLRDERVTFLVPIERADACLGALYVGMPFSAEEPTQLLDTLAQILRRFSAHIGHAIHKFALYDEATLDALTGLLTKRQYLARIEEISNGARRGRPTSLIVCDLDKFKSINDTYGHATGDVVLKRVANILSKVIRSDDLAFRFGGEEMVVLTDQGVDGATRLAERLRIAITELTIKSKGDVLPISASFGVSGFGNGTKTGEQLFERADEAVYASKEGGRNRVSVWTPKGIKPASDTGYLEGEDVRASA